MEESVAQRTFETTGKTGNGLLEIKLDRPLFVGGSFDKGHVPYIIIADFYASYDYDMIRTVARKLIYSSVTFRNNVNFKAYRGGSDFVENLCVTEKTIERCRKKDNANEIRFVIDGDKTATCRNLEFDDMEIIHVKTRLPEFPTTTPDSNYFTKYKYLLKANVNGPYFLVDWQHVRGPNGIAVSYEHVEGVMFTECSVCMRAPAAYECITCRRAFCENKQCH